MSQPPTPEVARQNVRSSDVADTRLLLRPHVPLKPDESQFVSGHFCWSVNVLVMLYVIPVAQPHTHTHTHTQSVSATARLHWLSPNGLAVTGCLSGHRVACVKAATVSTQQRHCALSLFRTVFKLYSPLSLLCFPVIRPIAFTLLLGLPSGRCCKRFSTKMF